MESYRIIDKIRNIEKRPLTPGQYIVSLLSVIYLRVLFEGALEAQHQFGYSIDPLTGVATTIHYMFAFIVYFLTIVLVIKIIGGKQIRVRPLSRLALFCSPVILLPPVIDMIMSSGSGYELYYSFTWQHFPQVVINAFNPFADLSGITPGQRIEVFFVCLGAALYQYILECGIGRSLLSFVVIYLIICVFAFFPAVLGNLAELFVELKQSGTLSPGQQLMLWRDGNYCVHLAHFRFASVYLIMIGGLLLSWWAIDRQEGQVFKKPASK